MFQFIDDGKIQKLWINGDIADDQEWGAVQARINSDKPIEINVNSKGGDLPLALGMHAFFKDDFKNLVMVKVRGIAASAATLLLCIPGAKVTISENSFVFLHFPSVAMFDPQNADDLSKTLQQLETYGAAIVDIYARKTGLADDHIKKILKEERLLSASEAVNLGLCDTTEDDTNLQALNKDTLQKENPALYSDIFEAGKACGLKEERERLQGLDDLLGLDSDFSYSAKYESCISATQAAVDYVKKLKATEKEKRTQYLNGIRSDAAEIQVNFNPSIPEIDQEKDAIYKASVFRGFKLF